MKARWLPVVSLVAALASQGCGFAHRYVHKPWGMRTWIPAAACGLVGGAVGAVLEKEVFPGKSTASVRNADGTLQSIEATDSPEYYRGVPIGVAAGAVLCGLVGHAFEPDKVTPVPPPPPPPPTPTVEILPPPSSKRLILRGVNFDFNKSDIRPDSRPILDEAAEVLSAHPKVRISVEGHTDAIGSDAYNEKLSVRRAEAVFRYLVNAGVAPERMEVIGYGKTRPLAENETDEGRAQNRRVELHIVNQPEEIEEPVKPNSPAAGEKP